MNYLEPYQKKLQSQIENLPKLVTTLVHQHQSVHEKPKLKSEPEILDTDSDIDTSLQPQTAILPEANTEVFQAVPQDQSALETEIFNAALQDVIQQTYP